ncbi:MAG: mechanosensitive ion channel domain-containing protein [Bryobacteraceae bacterium]|jgi:small-conductance mechanosensitive channel
MPDANRRSRNVGLVLTAVVLAVGAVLPELLARFGGAAGADLAKIWSKPYFHVGGLPVTFALVLKACLFVIILRLVTRLARRFIRRQVLDRTTLDPGQRYSIEKATGYFIVLLGLLIGLSATGLSLSSLAFLGGAAGVVIGFGLQNIAHNFVSGLILLVERPIKIGDRIEVGSLNGDVVQIGARSTWIRTNDNVVIIVPNSEFITSRVINWTANDRQVRFSLPVGVSYGSQPERVREILETVASAHPDVLPDPPPETLFVAFGDSSLNFELRVWTRNQVQTPKRLISDLYFAIFRRFREEGIEIPFPQRDLHLRSVDGTALPACVAGAGTPAPSHTPDDR